MIWGLPTNDSSLFTIRVSYTRGEELRADASKRALLCSALESMTPEARAYMGLSGSVEPLLDWLKA